MEENSRSLLDLDPFGSPNQRKSARPDNELLEVQTQGNSKPKNEPNMRLVLNGSGLINQADQTQQESPSWFSEDSLEIDLFQEYFSEIPNFNTTLGGSSSVEKVGPTNLMNYPNFSNFSKPIGKSKEIQQKVHSELGESSKLGSNICTSNQEQATVERGPLWFKDDTETTRISSEKMYTSTNEMTATSSSGGSGGNFGKFGNLNANDSKGKEKVKEREGSESHSEDADDNEAMNPCKAVKKRSKRRSRAAEVHNLSERRRRERINEKMRALQELIPHCNKTDKASILDETIQYLKSLQMQLQFMWMASGMPPMMYPGLNPLMAFMGPVNPANKPQIQGLCQMPRVASINPSLATLNPVPNHLPQFVSPTLNPASNFHAQMQNFHIALERVQQAAQVANCNASGSHIAQSIQGLGPPGSIFFPSSGEFSTYTEKK